MTYHNPSIAIDTPMQQPLSNGIPAGAVLAPATLPQLPTPEEVAEMRQELAVITRTGRIGQYWHRTPAEAFARVGVGSEWTAIEWSYLDWYGPLETWRQPGTAVSDILINGPRQPLFVVEQGVMLNTNMTLHPQWIEWTQRQLLLRSAKLHPSRAEPWPAWPAPMLQGVADQLRYAVTRPPISRDGGTIAIRLLPERWRTLPDLIAEQVISDEAATLLLNALTHDASILIAGATGSGKTTLAAALLQARGIGDVARIVFVEDGGELPRTTNSVHLEVPAGEPAAFAQAVTFALRMKPRYIVVGEVRGGEAMAFLQAAATGHPGIGTIHATDVPVTLRNLERMAMLGLSAEAGGAGQAAATIVRGLITSPAVSLVVVHIGRTPNGRRSVLHIAEVLAQGTQGVSGDRFPCNDLFVYDSYQGQLIRSGYVNASWGAGQY